jgi:5'(3')-deoxyribonucleotidase
MDMDATIADIYPSLIEGLNLHYDLDLDPQKYREYFGDHSILHSDIRRDMVENVFSTDSFFRNLRPIEGAQSALAVLEEYYDIFVVTSPWLGSSRPYLDKYYWLQDYFPRYATKMIATRAKHIIEGDLLVDDHMPFAKEWKERHVCGRIASLAYTWTDTSLVDYIAPTWEELVQNILRGEDFI